MAEGYIDLCNPNYNFSVIWRFSIKIIDGVNYNIAIKVVKHSKMSRFWEDSSIFVPYPKRSHGFNIHKKGP